MESKDSIAVRLSQILIKLNNGERLRKDELAKEFNISTRTISRDFKLLEILPIEKEGKEYFLADYALGKLSFKDIKNFAMLVGVKSLFPSFDNSFITDILNDKINCAFLIKNQGYSNIEISRDEFDEISAAVIKHWVIECKYNDKDRVLKPYKLINNNGIWYLLADDNGALKNFTLSKLKNIKIKDEFFKVNNEFIKRINENSSNWFSDKNFEVILEIKNEAKEYFKRKDVFPKYNIISQNNNSFTISTEVAYDDEVLSIVKYWLPYIKIISPIELREKFTKLLKEYIKD